MVTFSFQRFEQIQLQLRRDGYVDGRFFASVLRASAATPMPDDVLDYVCRIFDGTTPVRFDSDFLAKKNFRQQARDFEKWIHRKFYSRFKARKAAWRAAYQGKQRQPKRPFGNVPLGELAAKATAKYFRTKRSPRTIQNRISARKSKSPPVRA
jgi:hypothetical protein